MYESNMTRVSPRKHVNSQTVGGGHVAELFSFAVVYKHSAALVAADSSLSLQLVLLHFARTMEV